jgi:SHS2 domain-containing protein
MRNFETFATSADIGIRFRGPDFSSLYQNAVAGLNALLFGRAVVAPGKSSSRRFRFRGDSTENVLVNLLAEVLSLAYRRRRRVVAMDIFSADEKVLDAGLRLAATGAVPEIDIKAVTYHGLRVSEKDGIKKASVLFDV